MLHLKEIFFLLIFLISYICKSQTASLNCNFLQPLNKNDQNYFSEKTFDGIITKEGFKLHDSVYGEMRLYEQSKLITVMNFVNEELNGNYFAYFFPSGNIYLIGSHKNGKKEGVWKEYNVEGKLVSTKKYKNDEQIE